MAECLDSQNKYAKTNLQKCNPLKVPSFTLYLLGSEKKLESLQVYVIRWHPSQCAVDLIEEVMLNNNYDPNHVIEKVLFLCHQITCGNCMHGLYQILLGSNN